MWNCIKQYLAGGYGTKNRRITKKSNKAIGYKCLIVCGLCHESEYSLSGLWICLNAFPCVGFFAQLFSFYFAKTDAQNPLNHWLSNCYLICAHQINQSPSINNPLWFTLTLTYTHIQIVNIKISTFFCYYSYYIHCFVSSSSVLRSVFFKRSFRLSA